MEYKMPNEDSHQFNEPGVPYGVKRKLKLRIYKSFEEATEAEALADSLQSPVERILETVELILRVYGVTREQLKDRRRLKLTIIQRR